MTNSSSHYGNPLNGQFWSLMDASAEKVVPSGLFTLVIKFSKPMAESISLYNSTSGADFPPVKSYAWRDDKTFEVTFLLEPPHQYGL